MAEPPIQTITGVWAGRDCELVRTGRFSLLFERQGRAIAAILQTLDFEDDQLGLETWVTAAFDPAAGRALVRSRGEDDEPAEPARVLWAGAADGWLMLSDGDRVVERLCLSTGRLRLTGPSGTQLELERVERIAVVPPAEGRPVTSDTLAACLQEWALGSASWQDPERGLATLDIRTNRHLFTVTFGSVDESSLLYLRAARVRCTGDGVVVAPNIRLTRSPSEFTAWMPADNLAVCRADLEVDAGALDLDPHSFSSSGSGWLVEGSSPDLILLRGQGDETYELTRPRAGSDPMLERFEYREYEAAAL